MSNVDKFTAIQYPIELLDKVLTVLRFPGKYKQSLYKVLAWMLTYYFYFALFYCYTLLGSVKGTLNPPCIFKNETGYPSIVNSTENRNCSAWEPFVGDYGNTLLGVLNFVTLFSLAILNVIMGNVTDHFDYRYNLCLTGIILFLYSTLFGSGYYLEIHSFPYYVFAQILLGLGSCGLGGCLGVLRKWFDGKRSGIIIGIWSTSAPVARILGRPLASIWSDYAWGASFYSSSIITATATILVFLFLVPGPKYLHHNEKASKLTSTPNINKNRKQKPKERGIFICKALRIPGVVEYTISQFFIYMAFYSSFFWFPYIIKHSKIEGVSYATSISSIFSIVFDLGAMVGVAIGGGLSYLLKSHSIVITLYLYLSILLLSCYYLLYTVKLVYNLVILFSIGFTLGGAYVIIVISIPIALSKHKSLEGNTNSVGTIFGIITSIGGIGGALGGFLPGYLIQFGIPAVLFLIMISALLSGLSITRITFRDCCKVVKNVYSCLMCNRHVYVLHGQY